MNLFEYMKDAEDFISKVEKEYYLHFAGLKPNLNLKSIYDGYESLFTHESLNSLKNLSEKIKKENKGNIDEEKRALYLFQFCLEGYLSNKFQNIADKIANIEAITKINIDGKDVPFRYSDILLLNEEDTNKRRLIEDKRRETISRVFNPDLKIYWESLHEESLRLGYKSYLDLFMYVKGIDIYKLDKEMDMLLEATTELYEYHIGKLFKEKLGIDVYNSRASDFAFVKRAKEFDVYFKKENMIPVFKESMRLLNIDIDKQDNIIMDTEERETKSPRAFCCTVKVPSEIYLVILPGGGQDDYVSLFHEGGHAEHFANTMSNLDFPFRYLGDSSLTEGYAFCFESFASNKNWLKDILNMNNQAVEDFTYFLGLINLFFLRRYAGKLKYEILLHSEKKVDNKDELYSEILSENLIVKYFPEDYLRDVDEGFYCVNYIRAWIFEAQLRNYMLNKFGYTWYKNKKASDLLKELWSYGQKYSPEEVLNFLDYKNLDINFLIDNTIEVLNKR